MQSKIYSFLTYYFSFLYKKTFATICIWVLTHMQIVAKEQGDSAIGEWVNILVASSHHKAIPP